MSSPPAEQGYGTKIGIAGGIGIVCLAATLVATAIVLRKANEIDSKQQGSEVKIGNLGKVVQNVPSTDEFKKLIDTTLKQTEQIHYLAGELKAQREKADSDIAKVTEALRIERERSNTLSVKMDFIVRKMREEGKLPELDGLVMLQNIQTSSPAGTPLRTAPVTQFIPQQAAMAAATNGS